MIYAIPVVGWLVGLFFHTMLAIPFYFVWNGLAPVYFYWLPEVYKHIDFWTIVGLFILLSILKSVLLPNFGTNVSTKK